MTEPPPSRRSCTCTSSATVASACSSGPLDHIPSQRKLAAARPLLERLGAPLDDAMVVRGLYSLESGQAGASRLFAAGATAIVCASDPLALGAVRAARRAGLHVPQDVSVVGFDDSALMSCTEPPLTTVRQPIESMGRTVIELLLSQIAGTTEAGDELLFEPELVLRSSTGPVAAALSTELPNPRLGSSPSLGTPPHRVDRASGGAASAVGARPHPRPTDETRAQAPDRHGEQSAPTLNRSMTQS